MYIGWDYICRQHEHWPPDYRVTQNGDRSSPAGQLTFMVSESGFFTDPIVYNWKFRLWLHYAYQICEILRPSSVYS